MRRLYLFIFLALPLTIVAGDGFISRLRFRTDTAYVVRPPYRFTIRPNIGAAFGQFTTRWSDEIGRYNCSILSEPIFKVGVNFSAYGLSVGIHRDVENFFRKKIDSNTEFYLGGYAPYIGGDVTYCSSNHHTMRGNTTNGDAWSQPISDCHIRRFLANGYVVLNPRRFSLPAVLTQRHRQVKSAGSAIVGLSITGFRLDANVASQPQPTADIPVPNGNIEHLIFTTINASAGYAYNWVVSTHWMLHASYMHSLSVWHYGEMAYTGHTMPIGHKLNQSGLMRLSAVWDRGRYFGGFTGTMQVLWMHHNPMSFSDLHTRTNVYFGFRF